MPAVKTRILKDGGGRVLPVVGAAAVVILSSALVLLVPVPGGGAACPASATGRATATPVQHVFFIIKENHAFENYFGTFPGVVGGPPNGSFPLAYGSSESIDPFPLNATSTADLPHDRGNELAAYDQGRNDLFVAQARAAGYANANDTVGYYTEAQIPAYFALARDYALADGFFSGVMAPTLPNRVFDLAGTSGGWTNDSPPPPSAMTFPTILDQLSSAGIPWAYDYLGPTGPYLTPLLFPSIAGNECERSRVQPMAALAGQLAGPAPPAVTFIDPSHDSNLSEHPPGNVTVGSDWTAAVLQAIFSSPIAGSSVAFVFFDEAGGFWDPVAPPQDEPLGDGFRIPMLVVSPWTPAGALVHAQWDPTGLLSFVDANWGLTPLSPRVANASLPSGFFNFTAPPRPYSGPVSAVPISDARPVPAPTARPEPTRGGSPPGLPSVVAVWGSPSAELRRSGRSTRGPCGTAHAGPPRSPGPYLPRASAVTRPGVGTS